MLDGLHEVATAPLPSEDWQPRPARLWFAIGVGLMLTAGMVSAAMLAWALLL